MLHGCIITNLRLLQDLRDAVPVHVDSKHRHRGCLDGANFGAGESSSLRH